MNRKERRAARRAGVPPAAGPAARTPTELFGAAMAAHRAGALGEAEQRYRHILTLFPDHPEAHGMLGIALFTQGRASEAIAHFERTAALRPDLPGPFDDLGKACLAAGQPGRAIRAAIRALELDETERRKAFFAHCAKFVGFGADDGRLRALMLRALTEAWARPRELAHASISLIKLDGAVSDLIRRTTAAWPDRLPAADSFDSPALFALANDRLLGALLETDPIADLELERLLANVRAAMLARAADDADDDSLLAFYCAVARQCFINEYVYAMTDDEAVRAEEWRTRLDAALAAGLPCPALWPAIVGAYFPLSTLTNAQALLDRSWPQSVDALVTQQIRDPAQERQIASTIPALTPIDGGISSVVREQYEENPYPRWVTAGPPGQPPILGERPSGQAFDALIAGCGTGLATSEFARYARGARILAVDLSLASLSYAKRMAQKLGLSNVEFVQADIMKLGTIDRRFDFIDASGVLHHLVDPFEGWRILLSLLRPGGTMEVGLYSATARRNVVAARAIIAQRGFRPVAADIRLCREYIAAAPGDSLLHSLTRSDDFFTTSACRDLLFHPQEHRLNLPDIKAFLTANNLQFAGFVLPPVVLSRFAARFPGQAAASDLERWQTFEAEAPDTFAGMYTFALRKPSAASTPS